MAVRTTDASANSASTPGTLSVGSSAAKVLVANPKRRSLIIQNITNVNVWVGYGTGLTALNGIRLRPGESWYEDVYTGAVWMIGAVGGLQIPYLEVS